MQKFPRLQRGNRVLSMLCWFKFCCLWECSKSRVVFTGSITKLQQYLVLSRSTTGSLSHSSSRVSLSGWTGPHNDDQSLHVSGGCPANTPTTQPAQDACSTAAVSFCTNIMCDFPVTARAVNILHTDCARKPQHPTSTPTYLSGSTAISQSDASSNIPRLFTFSGSLVSCPSFTNTLDVGS